MKVSVVIPAYNAAETLGETLESLVAQTDSEWEAIVVDDGSTDQTRSIAERYADSDSRFRIIHQANAGVSAARNAGIKLARFDWLLFIDADDWVSPRYLEYMTSVLISDESLDAVYCGWCCISVDGFPYFTHKPKASGDLFPLLARDWQFATHACVVRKSIVEAVGGFDQNLETNEDWDLWQRVARFGARFGTLQRVLAFYRTRAGSVSKQATKVVTDSLRVLEQGYGADPRVPKSHPVYPEGLTQNRRAFLHQKYWLVCYAVGLALGSEENPEAMLPALAGERYADLSPVDVAAWVVPAALDACGRPLREWDAAWNRLEPRFVEFLDALEAQAGTGRLAPSGCQMARGFVCLSMARLGPRYRLRALQARTQILICRLTHVMGHPTRFLQRLKPLVENGLRMAPKARQLVYEMRRRYRFADEDQALFDELFEEFPDPWDYTNEYEQTKYAQTLDLITESQIDDALELACAEGHFTVQLAPRVQRLLATDLSQVALDRAAERCRDLSNVSFQCLDFVKDDLPGRFDLIVLSEALYFCHTRKKLRAVARKLAQALKPGGCLVMAHARVVADEPHGPGFAWNVSFGAKTIGETFTSLPSLRPLRELRTPFYQIQLFQRLNVQEQKSKSKQTPTIFEMDQPTPLPPHVVEEALWNGSAHELPILLYHRVAPTGSRALAQWRVTPEAFEAQLRYLRDAGFQSIHPSDCYGWLYEGYALPSGAVLITFDDGYRDFLEFAWPLLQRYGFLATVYLVAGNIGGTNKWDAQYGEKISLLGWHEIRELQRGGVSFGSHSFTHPILTRMSPKRVGFELKHSKDILQQGLGVEVKSLAYPFGETNGLVRVLAGVSGYDLGLSYETGLSTTKDSPLMLPRVEVEGADTLERFRSKLERVTPRRSRSLREVS